MCVSVDYKGFILLFVYLAGYGSKNLQTLYITDFRMQPG